MTAPADHNLRAADPRNYQLPGSVSLWLRNVKDAADDTKWLDVGNVINPDIEGLLKTLKHASQRRGDRAVDKEVTTEREATLKFKIDEINSDNLKLAFLQGDALADGTYDANFDKIVVNPGSGGTIDLGQTSIKNVLVRSTSLGSPTTYVVTTDYTVDLTTGILTIAAGALASPGSVPEIHIFFQKNVTTKKFLCFPEETLRVQARFQVFTPGGVKYALEALNTVIRPNGAITIGDGQNWQEIALMMDVLLDPNGDLMTGHVVTDGQIAD